MLTSATGLRAKSAYHLPDEGAPHERTFMQWPVNLSIYPERGFLADLQATIARLAHAIAEFEPVVMLMANEHKASAQRVLGRDIEIWDIPTDDLWARDSGPVFVQSEDGQLAVRSLNFNGWGDKQTHTHDGEIAKRVADHMGLPFLDNKLVGELGGVERAPDGVLLANRSSWVNPNRNEISEAEITALLLDALGGTKMIWSDGVMGMDITDDHIDATARFLGSNDIVIQLPRPSKDPFAIAAHNLKRTLERASSAKGDAYRLHIIDEPYHRRVLSADFVASYVNYYLCNGALIMPEFGDAKADSHARQVLEAAYPEREIVALNVDSIGEVGGGIHCATQQQPRVSPL